MFRLALGLLLFGVVSNPLVAERDQRRPFFVIGHMVNSILEIEHFLSRGANAIEVDISFHPNGSVHRLYHGIPCDCYRRCSMATPFETFFEHLRDMRTSNDTRLVLVMLDLKLSDFEAAPGTLRFAGGDLFQKLVQHLWNGVDEKDRLNVVISIQSVEQKEFFVGFLEHMKEDKSAEHRSNIAFDVSMNANPTDIESMYESLGVDDRMWQGDGISNCFVGLRPEERLRKVLELRDSPSGYVRKVYYWTVDMSLTMERVLEKGVDAIITNSPERVVSLISKNSSIYRLADVKDSFLEKIAFDNTTAPPHHDAGYGIYNTGFSIYELASQASGYLVSLVTGPPSGRALEVPQDIEEKPPVDET